LIIRLGHALKTARCAVSHCWLISDVSADVRHESCRRHNTLS